MVYTRSQISSQEGPYLAEEMNKEHDTRNRKRRFEDEIAKKSSMEMIQEDYMDQDHSEDEKEEQIRGKIFELNMRFNDMALEIHSLQKEFENYKSNKKTIREKSNDFIREVLHKQKKQKQQASSSSCQVITQDDQDIEGNQEDQDMQCNEDDRKDKEDISNEQEDDPSEEGNLKGGKEEYVPSEKDEEEESNDTNDSDDYYQDELYDEYEWTTSKVADCLLRKKMLSYDSINDQEFILHDKNKYTVDDEQQNAYYTITLNNLSWCLCLACFRAGRSPDECIKLDPRGIQAHKKPAGKTGKSSCVEPFKKVDSDQKNINGDVQKMIESPKGHFIFFKFPFDYKIQVHAVRMESKNTKKHAGKIRFKHNYMGNINLIDSDDDYKDLYERWLKNYICKRRWDILKNKQLTGKKYDDLLQFGIIETKVETLLPETPDTPVIKEKGTMKNEKKK